MKRGFSLLFSALILIIMTSTVSAGLFDFLNPSGRASSGTQNVSITVAGVTPVTVSVPTISANPVEFSSTSIVFTANVTDPNGVNDIDDSSVTPQISNGVTTRLGTCTWSQDYNSTSANYSCSVTMRYYDESGSSWILKVQARDFGNGSTVNGTSVFTYNQLKSMVISPSTLFWPTVIPGSTNQQSNNDPTTINNTGNYNGTVSVTALNLQGETISSELIAASDFRAGPSSGSECSATQLQNATQISIGGSNSNPGNLSLGGGVGQSNIYYCIPTVPSVSSQVYSTTGGGSWTVLY